MPRLPPKFHIVPKLRNSRPRATLVSVAFYRLDEANTQRSCCSVVELRWSREMPRHYRLTSRSLPLKRPSRISELARAYPVRTAGLLMFASLNALLWSLPYGTPSSTLPTFTGSAPTSLLTSGPALDPQGGTEVANVPSELVRQTEIANETVSGPGEAAALIGTVASRELPERALVETEVTEERETDLAEEVEHRSPTPQTLTGTWAPKRAACDKRVAARTGWLPMKISDRGAHAGQTTCSFRKLDGGGGEWTAVAECHGPRGHWTSNVRLNVAASSLTWSSARGVRRYVRCDRVQVASR